MPTSKELKDLDSQLKKTIISAESFKRGSSFDLSKNLGSIHKNIGSLAGHTRKLVIRVSEIEKKVNNNSKKITSLKNISKTQSGRISGTNIGAKLPGGTTSNVEENIAAIAKSVNSIAEIFAGRKKLADDTAAYEKRKAEQEKRGLAESKLEKVFKGIAKTAEKVIAPVKSLLDRILDFIGTVILGRIVFKIIEWMGDPKNQSKVKSIIRFFSDWGPTLLSLYIVFGTSFGKFARGLISLVIKSTVRLGAAVAGLAVKAGIGKAGGKLSKVAGFLGGRKGKLLAAGLETAITVGGTMALSNTLKGDGGSQQKAQGLSGGGYVRPRFRAFSGGGFNFKGMMGGAGMGAMFGPLGMLLGGAMGGSSGFVSGPGGPKDDKIPAMLSDGEFVMSAGAVQKYGVDTFEQMNAAGGGTNKPKIISGTTYAAGGGRIGGRIGKTGDYRANGEDPVEGILNWFGSQGVNLQDPRTWAGTGGKFATGVMNGLQQGANQVGNFGMNQFSRANSYLASGGLEKDVSKIMQSGTQFGAGLYDQALKVGNQALADVQSGKLQNQLMQTGNNIAQTPKKAAGGFFDFMKNMGSSKGYQNIAATTEKLQDKSITLGDKFIKNLPDGPFKEVADKGLIPIPSGNPTMMRNLTFIKALLGPVGRPFKILSNKQVDEMRRKTIEKTMGKSGLIVDPKTGEVKMNWNQEDINKAARGGGAYTDDLGPGGSSFNSILGRFTASTEGKGNTLYTDDRYNFNKTVAEYAEMAKNGLMKGSISDATYFGASMLGRFAQDIGWLNQRALGSRIEIGKIDRSTLDPSTGKRKSSEQIAADQAKMKQEAARVAKQRANKEKLEAKRPWWDKFGMFGGGSRVAQEQAKQAKIAKTKPKAANIAQSTKPKPKVTVVSAPKPKNKRGGGRTKTKTPNFGATCPKNGNQKKKILGIF